MRQDGFTLTPALSRERERVEGAPLPVILSGDHARAGSNALPRRNPGRGERPVPQNEVGGAMAAGDLKVAPTPVNGCMR